MVEAISTERLVLRRARAEDAAALHPIFTDAQAMQYWSTLPHEAFAQTEQWVADMMAPPPGLSDDFIVTVDGMTIGKLGCWRLPEVGFLFARDCWGKGYASEALTAFLDHRRRMSSREIIADTDPRNMASIGLLQRHGFVETGRAKNTWLIGGQYYDSIYWRLAL